MVTGVIPAIRETVASLLPAGVSGLGCLPVPSGGDRAGRGPLAGRSEAGR